MDSQIPPMQPLGKAPLLVSASKTSYGPQILSPPSRKRSSENVSSSSRTMQTSLASKLVGDAVVGTGVTFLMAPFLTVVDRAIAQRAAGTHTLAQSGLLSLHALRQSPVAFARNPAFLYVWAVYASTYTTANSLKTLVEHHERASTRVSSTQQQDQDRAAFGRMGIFLGTSAANSGASLTKDRAFAFMFSPESASTSTVRKVPMATYGLWMSRDLIGVGSSFILPDLIAGKLSESNPENMKRNRDISQFCVPIATQLIAGPLHLLGLDLFNRPMQEMPFKHRVLERVSFLASGYTAVVGARVARIIPGYGFGGVLNTNLRDNWRDYLIERDDTESYSHVTLSDKIGSLLLTIMQQKQTATLGIDLQQLIQ